MNIEHGSLSRPIVGLLLFGIALAGVTMTWGQNPAPQAARQPATVGQPQSQPQNVNPNAPTAAQSANQADQRGQPSQAGSQAGQVDRPAIRTNRANSADSRQSRTSRDEEQEDAAWLGIYLSQRDNERGATVAQVYPSGPAARAGIYPGDVIQQINGQAVASGSELVGVLEHLHPGDKAELSVLRNNEPTKLTAKLGSRNGFISSDRQTGGSGGRGGQYNEDEDQYNFPLHAMELEHNRRNAEQHQRIENEIAQLREEIRQLRETLQRR